MDPVRAPANALSQAQKHRGQGGRLPGLCRCGYSQSRLKQPKGAGLFVSADKSAFLDKGL
jgi:hypothetical protein